MSEIVKEFMLNDVRYVVNAEIHPEFNDICKRIEISVFYPRAKSRLIINVLDNGNIVIDNGLVSLILMDYPTEPNPFFIDSREIQNINNVDDLIKFLEDLNNWLKDLIDDLTRI